MSDQAVVEEPVRANTSKWLRICSFLRKHSRKVAYGYAAVLLIVTSIQALCLLFLWRPPQDWVSFGARVVTSPAMAGVFAVVAASIGAVQLSKQLSHTKEKAADEAWWQQFEWVTDRVIVPAGQKSDAETSRLPMSLAFDLMNSLSRVARAQFQKDAVGGIATHYLKDFHSEKPEDSDETEAAPDEPEKTPTMGDTGMGAAAAHSLRNLIPVLPESSRESARRVLADYDAQNYETEIAKALRHHGFHVTRNVMKRYSADHIGEADIIATIGDKKIIGDIKLSIRTPSALTNAVRNLRKLMKQEGATHGVIFTPPTNVTQLVVSELALQGINVVLWEPNMRSFELKRQIDEILGDPPH